MDNLSEKDWDYLRELVLDSSGVLLSEKGSLAAVSRLDSLLSEFHLLEPAMLIELVREAGQKSPLAERVVGALVESDTFFFRDSSAFEYIRYDALPKLIARNMDSRRLRIWCGGCSTGQEVYSLAVMLLEAMPEIVDWDVEILGSDINRRLIDQAKTGVYSQQEVDQGLPKELSFRHFKKIGPQWVIREDFRRCTRFRVMNLLTNWEDLALFDIILMRNVLQYFQTTARYKVLAQLHRHMHEDSYLFVGNSESIDHNLFERVLDSNAPCYRRIEGELGTGPDGLPVSVQGTQERSLEFKMGSRLSMSGPEFQHLSQLANRTYLFKGMSLSEMEAVCRKIELFEFRARQVIIEQGQPGTAFYIICTGHARVLRRKGFFRRSESLALLGPGDVFGEMALIFSENCNASVVAEGPLKAFVCEREVFEELSTKSETFGATLRAIANERGASPAPANDPEAAVQDSSPSGDTPPSSSSDSAVGSCEMDPVLLDGVLAGNSVFGTLGGGDRKQVIACAELLSFAPGDVIINEGEHSEYFYVIYEGCARALAGNPGFEVASLVAGDHFWYSLKYL